MKNSYYDDNPVKQNKKHKKKRQPLKVLLVVLSVLVIGAAAFVLTIKFLAPDFDFTSLVPQQAASFVQEKVLQQTTEATTEETMVYTTTTAKPLTYLESEEFAFETGKQGSEIGNLLGGGKVATDGAYVYHIVDGKGIYRFTPSTESYTLVYDTKDTLSCLNLRGDYYYFVNETDGKLCKMQKGTKKVKAIAEDVRFVYVYDQRVYYITNTNTLCVMDAKQLTPVSVYYAADDTLQLIGISKGRIFFALHDSFAAETAFLTIDTFAKSPAVPFRPTVKDTEETGFVMENGFLYYTRANGDGAYTLCRQKFGSEKVMELATTATNRGYPIVNRNRLYFTDWQDSRLVMKELNMNSGEIKTMLKSGKLSETENAAIQHGGEYDFIIGDGVYCASSNLTASTNVMQFKDGKWRY